MSDLSPPINNATDIHASRPSWTRLVGRPPIPREHGAWVILYAPLVIGFGASGHVALVPAFLLALAVTGAFLSRYAADLVLRKRGDSGIRFWLTVYVSAFAVGSTLLLFAYRRTDLLLIGGAVSLVFGVHAALSLQRKRFDRTAAGELLAVSALVMTGPAAVITARGSFDPLAVHLWLLCALFFGSGVLHVNLFLVAAKFRGEFTSADRAQVNRPSLLYHLLIVLILPFAAYSAVRAALPALILLAGCAPAIVRAFIGAATVSNTLPPLKRVGLLESAYALWFAICIIIGYGIR